MLTIRAREIDWRNLERVKELLVFAQPSARVNQTYALSEALRIAVVQLEREAAGIVAEGNGRAEQAETSK